ncbi:hypothetical protein [Maritimibacter fusiformis]|uniref:Uncharacterized protein n=1 Tax=Maritimibacter fusiformis TaxID=2603819 RepID=A0A5D0RPK3_9RHOB|nr:hypothetical protein [Maritimibacter fusiformis]TYB83482.1 hypothetical protein FVF75_00180 [Maritimibacter fusiformis]
MKRINKNSPETRRICEDRINYAKLKKDGAIAASEVRTEEQAPVSEVSHEHAHPLHADDGTRAPAYHQEKEDAAMNESETRVTDTAETQDRFWFVLNVEERIAKIDYALIGETFSHLNISAEQEREIMTTLYLLMAGVVDFGFGLAPSQEVCGKLEAFHEVCATDSPDVVRSDKDTLTETFNTCAAE